LYKQEVVINEIAWAGTQADSTHEWIELYNNTEGDIDLTNWKLKAEDGEPLINLSGTIPAQGFYLLETNENATSEPHNLTYSGILEDLPAGENLKLYDEFGNLVEEVNCDSGWFVGENSSKSSMERINSRMKGSEPGNWKTIGTIGTASGGNETTLIDATKNWKEDEWNGALITIYSGPCSPVSRTIIDTDATLKLVTVSDWGASCIPDATSAYRITRGTINGLDANGNPIIGTPKNLNSVGVKPRVYPSFSQAKQELEEKLTNPELQEEMVYILRREKNLEKLLNSPATQNTFKKLLVETVDSDDRLKSLLKIDEVLRILLEDKTNFEALLGDAHAEELFRELLEMAGNEWNNAWNEFKSTGLKEAQTNLKLINEFKRDLEWVQLAQFLMTGCQEDPVSFDQMKGMSPLQEMKIEYVSDWQKLDTMIEVIDPKTGSPVPIYDPAIFYCHKLLW